MTDKILNIALIALAGVTVGACADSPENPMSDPAKYITFSAPRLEFSFQEGGFSRAELVDEISDFTVWGYCIPRDVSGNLDKNQAKETWANKSEFFTDGPDVLDGYRVRVDGSNTSYDKDNPNGSTSNPMPWFAGTDHPGADDYNYGFIAASSPVGTFNMTATYEATKAHPVLKFELPYTSNNIATELDPAQQPDALIGTKFDQYNNSKVALNFQHIMTGLRFRFHNQSDDELVIKRVTFSGEFYKSADFSFETETWNSTVTGDTYSGTFVLLNQNQTIISGTSDLMRHDGDPTGRSVKLLLLPNPHATIDDSENEIDNWALGRQKQITIVYTIGGGADRTFTTDKDFRLSYIPDPNTLHTANFHFVGDDFVITFQADNNTMWENGSDNNLIIH